MTCQFACPICGAPLTKTEKIFLCPAKHSFDRSSSGYVNLLLSKDSRGHGDNGEMIRARNRFLSGGWYQPLLDAVKDTVLGVFPKNGVLLDAGCGEGWYTEQICQSLFEQNIPFSAYGIDISKDALKIAGKRPLAKAGKIDYAVGRVYKMPILPNSVDLVLNLFAPLATEAYTAVLKQGGFLLLAVPDRFHLWSLKRVLYDTPYENQVADSALAGFSLLEEKAVSATITLPTNQTLMDLFLMTPYAFRTGQSGINRLLSCETLTTEIAFRVFLYRVGEA